MGKYVTHIRYSGSPRVITHLKSSTVEERSTVVGQINSGTEYTTQPPSGSGAKIHVVNNRFLSTNPDEKTSDNLGNLPEF